jgi:hypothetical protein
MIFKINLSILLVCLIFNTFYNQNPAEELYFGKMNNKYMVYQKPLLKIPENWRAISIKDVKKNSINRSILTIHFSRTFIGDTVSISKNNEFVSMDFKEFTNDLPIAYVSDFVTNKEWLLFRKYVIDSIYRTYLAEDLGYADWTYPNIIDVLNDKSEYVFNIDWREKISYEMKIGNFLFPIYAALLHWDNERYNELIKINENKLEYLYYMVNEFSNPSISRGLLYSDTNLSYIHIKNKGLITPQKVSLVKDSLNWIKQYTNQINGIEEGIATYYNWHKYFLNFPVVGLNAPQAQAYLAWLEYHHNQSLRRKNKRFMVHYQLLPYYANVESIQPLVKIDSFDLSHWKISYKEYSVFVEYVRDSIARMELGNHFPQLYKIPKLDNELQEMSVNYWVLNFRNSVNMDLFNQYVKDNTLLLDSNLYYRYSRFNVVETGLANQFTIEGYKRIKSQSYCEKMKSKDVSFPYFKSNDLPVNLDYFFISKDKDLSYYNEIGESTDILGHDKYLDLFSIVNTSVARFDTSYYHRNNSDDLIQEITYNQFQCYWHWRYKIKRFAVKNNNPVIQNYIPTEEEFFEIQKGRSCYHSEEQHNIPTPTFRYIVTFQEL